MNYLLPGYAAQAELELARQAAALKLDRLPWAPAFSAGAIHVVETREAAEAWVDRLHDERISMIGVDTEFAFDGPVIELRNGKPFVDLATIRPQVCTVVAWCGAGRRGEEASHLIPLLFDL